MKPSGTLVEVAGEIRESIIKLGIEVVIVDSLTYALGGDKNDMQSVLAGLAAFRQWPEGITIIAIDHVTKDDSRRSGARGPIGSVFVENTSRNCIRVLGWQDPETGDLHQLLRQTKQNKGMIGDYGLVYHFSPDTMNPDAITVEREDPPFDVEAKLSEKPAPVEKTVEEKAAQGPQRQAVYAFVKEHPERFWTVSGVAERTKISTNTVRSAVTWLLNEGLLIEGSKATGSRAATFGASSFQGGFVSDVVSET